MRALLLLMVLLAPALTGGCVGALLGDRPHARLEGVADGYTPFSQRLLVYVEEDVNKVRQAAFDRDVWYLVGLEEALDERQHVILEGSREGVTRIVAVRHAVLPDTLDAYRWENREEPAAQHARMDAAWDRRVGELGGEGAYVPLPEPGEVRIPLG